MKEPAKVLALVVKKDQVLLLQRLKPQYAGHWTAPGGKQDKGESLKQTASREVEEETGLQIEVLEELVGKGNSDDPSAPRVYLAKVVGGELNRREPTKHSSVNFFPLGNLPGPLAPTTKKAIELFKARNGKVL